jgi:hypothetical protein
LECQLVLLLVGQLNWASILHLFEQQSLRDLNDFSEKKGSGRACLCNFLRKISPLISKNFLKKKNAFTCLLIDVDLISLRHQ